MNLNDYTYDNNSTIVPASAFTWQELAELSANPAFIISNAGTVVDEYGVQHNLSADKLLWIRKASQ